MPVKYKGNSRTTNSSARPSHGSEPSYIDPRQPQAVVPKVIGNPLASTDQVSSHTRNAMRGIQRGNIPPHHRTTARTLKSTPGSGPSDPPLKCQGSFPSLPGVGSGAIGHSVSPAASCYITPPPSDDSNLDSPLKPKRTLRRRKSIVDDHDEAEEVERVLTEAYLEDPPVFSKPSLRPSTFVWLKPLVVWVAVIPLVVWTAFIVLHIGQVAISHFEPTTPAIPLHFIAWSISSNAMHLRDSMKSLQPIRSIAQAEFNNMAVTRFADEVETIAKNPRIADLIRDYVKLTEVLQDATSTVNIRASSTFRGIARDLSRADKLVKKLYPHRRDPTRPRNFEVEDQLLDLLANLYSNRLPTDLRALSSSFREAHSLMRQTTDTAQKLDEEMSANGNELARKLDVIPSKPGLLWNVNANTQRRTEMYRAAVESFKQTKELGAMFWQIDAVLAAYGRSLPLFQSPRQVRADHRCSNGTFQHFVNQIDDLMPQIYDLSELY